MAGALVIFAKTIGLSQVKTRLAKSIGKAKAQAFYALSLDAVQEVALEVKAVTKGDINPYWAVGETEGLKSDYWKNIDSIWTGEGGLGERLNHVYNSLIVKHEFVVIIGSDSPQISTDVILNAVNQLKDGKGNCIIGPCDDGGFYLFGGNSMIDKEVWTKVSYSKDDTLKQLTNKLSEYQIYNLPMMQDVDVIEDLLSLYEFFRKSEKLLVRQEVLSKWLKNHIQEEHV